MKHSTRLIWLITLSTGLLLLAAQAQAAGIPDFTKLVEQYSPAVVSINATPAEQEPSPESGILPQLPIPEDSPLYDYFRRFFDQLPNMPHRQPRTSLGSGFVISADGHILTNAHVTEDAEKITVGLSDRRELPARVVGKDPRSDIALLKIEAEDLPVVKIGDSRELKVGQWVLAIGSPFGFEHSATQGIISALGRSLPSDTYVPFIQTDAAVNPGSSGGPLFNLDGEVIGINSQIYSRTGGYMGLSFAVPINVAMEVAEQLKTHGKVSRGWLGVMIQEVTPDLARSFGLDRPHGALVSQVMEDSPAQKAELQSGDIIVSFNDTPINRSAELPPLVGRIRPGTTVPVTVIREGKERTLKVKIQELPEEPVQRAAVKPTRNRLNVSVTNLTPEQREQQDVQGVLVEEVGQGPGAQAGIRPGDIIVRLDNQPVNTVAEFEKRVKELPTDKPVPILIQRGEGALFLAVTIPEKQ